MVHVDGSEAGRRRVQFAVDLAICMGARLSGLHVTPPVEVPHLFKPSQVPKTAASISSKLALDARTAAALFSEEAMQRLPGASWFEATGDIAQGISSQARYSDLVILGQYERQGPPENHLLPIAHPVVLQCGRPVLIVPANVQPTAFEKIVIAWDGSREAVRAVHDALPILHLSRSIQIVTMISPSAENNEDDAKSLSAHLANHGIEVGTTVVKVREAKEHLTLQEQIEQGKYDLLVMGGYSHSMWAEFIFGSVTQSILLSSKIPVLVSH
jgi:nucleotide-binding universal stress UspA family protein